MAGVAEAIAGAGVAGVLGGGPGQMSPLRELLGLHPVVINAETDPEFKQLARSAYHRFDESCAIMIIKALSLKAEDLRELEAEHADQFVSLEQRRRNFQLLMEGVAYEAAAPIRLALSLIEPSIAYHLRRRIFAWRELKKIQHHLAIQYRKLENLV